MSSLTWLGRAKDMCQTLWLVRWQIASALAVAAASLYVRLDRLGSVPANLTADETDFFRDIYRIIHGSGFPWFYQGQPATLLPLGLTPMSWCVRIFGDSIFGLRMYSVLLSLATLALFFLAARQRLSFPSSLIGTVLLSTNIWFLHFSRTAWANMNAAFLSIAIVATLMLALDRRHWWWFAVSGFFIGLCPWAYASARVLPQVVLAFSPIALLLYRQHWLETLRGLALAGTVALIVAAPVLAKLRGDYSDQYLFRARAVSIFTGRSHEAALRLIPDNIVRTLEGFILLSNRDSLLGTDNIFRRSTEGVRYAPRDGNLADPISRVLFLAGLLSGAFLFRRTALWWLMLILPLSIQVLSVGTPDAARGLMLLPIVFLFIALGVETLCQKGGQLLRSRQRVLTSGAGVIALAVIAVCAWNVREYHDWMSSKSALEERGPMVWAGEFGEWSSLQKQAVAKRTAGFNTGDWRQRQDRAGCLTGWVSAYLCEELPGENPSSGLGAALIKQSDLPAQFKLVLRRRVSSDQFRQIHGARNDSLGQALADMTIEEAWAAHYDAGGQILTASVARLGSAMDAQQLLEAKASLDGGTYLGGPSMSRQGDPSLGEQSLLLSFRLSDGDWQEYFWREGAYVSHVQLRMLGPPGSWPSGAFDIARQAATAQAGRLSALLALP